MPHNISIRDGRPAIFAGASHPLDLLHALNLEERFLVTQGNPEFFRYTLPATLIP